MPANRLPLSVAGIFSSGEMLPSAVCAEKQALAKIKRGTFRRRKISSADEFEFAQTVAVGAKLSLFCTFDTVHRGGFVLSVIAINS